MVLKKIFLAIIVFILTIFPFNAVEAANKVNMVLRYDNKTYQYSSEEIILYVNGTRIKTEEMPPIILNQRTLVPAREVFEPLGAVVDWKNETRQVYIGYKDTLLILTVDDFLASIDGKDYEMDVPPKIINSKTMIPARFVAEALGLDVGWDPTERIVSISELKPSDPVPPVEPTPSQPSQPSNPTNDTPSAEPNTATDSSTDIKAENHPTTNITNIQLPNTGSEAYVIQSSSAISRVERMLLPDNRLVIDIYNSNMIMAQTTFTPSSPNVKSIRTSQFETQPERITRVVFDLNSTIKFNVSINYNRTNLIINFDENIIRGVDFSSDSISDYIKITGDTLPNVNVFGLDDPKRLVIDIPYSTSTIGEDQFDVNGVFANRIRIGFPEEKVTRIVIDLLNNADYSISTEGNVTNVQLKKHTYLNIDHTSGSGSILSKITLNKSGYSNIDINQIIHTDEYNSLRYKLTFPGDFSNLFGHGEIKINDGHINSIIIQNDSNNNTEIIINETNIYAYDVTEDADNIYINAMKPKSKYSKVLVLDAGHGAQDYGAGTQIHHGIYEKDANLSVLKKVYARLEEDKIVKVYATRLTDTYPTNPSRAKMANDIADIFVSIHHNSLENQQVTGTETLYCDRVVENNLTSKKMAEIFQRNIVQAAGTIDRGLKLRRDLIVLNQTTIPAVLLEIAFISNYNEAQRVKSESFQNAVAEAICKSIYEAFNVYRR